MSGATATKPWHDPSVTAMLARGLSKRCPRCGGGHLFTGWFAMKERCPRCDLRLAREEAHFVGAIAINVVFTEILFATMAIAWGVATWPSPPWLAITITAVAMNAIVPIVLYPVSKTTWTAFDLLLHRFDPIDRTTIELP